uniref:Uncharacterized protein n=1 Tax=Steinernema glaseri TaxID=37863 RepID=A0A1I7Y3Q4_9BILA
MLLSKTPTTAVDTMQMACLPCSDRKLERLLAGVKGNTKTLCACPVAKHNVSGRESRAAELFEDDQMDENSVKIDSANFSTRFFCALRAHGQGDRYGSVLCVTNGQPVLGGKVSFRRLLSRLSLAKDQLQDISVASVSNKRRKVGAGRKMQIHDQEQCDCNIPTHQFTPVEPLIAEAKIKPVASAVDCCCRKTNITTANWGFLNKRVLRS